MCVLGLDIGDGQERRELGRPLQMKAAPADEGGDEQQGDWACHHTTTVTSRPGMTLIILTAFEPTNLRTCSSASAAALTVSSSAFAATLIRPRSLPLTCTTSS